jgi:hypothetical protein
VNTWFIEEEDTVKARVFFVSICSALMVGCGGSSSNDGMVFQGQLTQGGAVAHAAAAEKHGAGQNIENVEICALSECSTTDADGNWGFVVSDSFIGGSVEFSINGHGIQTSASIDVPEGTQDVFVHFENRGKNGVMVHHLMIDGVRQ